jgi:hypothetical protein
MIQTDAAPVLAVGEPPAIASDPGRECGALPRPLARRIEAGMSSVSPPESRSAAIAAPRDPLVVARAGLTPALETRVTHPTPLYTRHMLGAIEADRDRRRASRGTARRRFSGGTVMTHPRIAAALAAEARRLAEARVAYSRWADEGGRFDPEAAARLRIGDRKMKRCNS